MGNALAVILLLIAAGFRLWGLSTHLPGFHNDEINDIRIAETARQGRIEVFYDLGGEGREGLYQTILTVTTGAIGGGLIGYRMLSVWLGLLTLAAVYALVKRLYTPTAAVAAMALLSVGMLPVMMSRMISRESALPLLLTGILLAFARAFSLPDGDMRRRARTTPFTALGLLLGAGFYVHPAHFIIALFSMVFIAYMIVRRPMSRRRLGYIGFALVIMIVVAMPYLISSIRLRELSGPARLFENMVTTRPEAVSSVMRGLGGLFLVGDQNALVNLPGRPMIDLVSGLFLVLGVVVALRYFHQSRFIMPLLATVALAPVTLMRTTSPDFVAMSLLLPLIALFFGVGVSALATGVPARSRPVFWLALVALFGFNIVWTSRDLFNRWPALPSVHTLYRSTLAYAAHYLDQTAGSLPTVLCVSNLNPATTPELENYEILALMMHRPNVPLRYANCGVALVLADGGEVQQVVFLDSSALENAHASIRNWLSAGEIIHLPGMPGASVVRLDVARNLADTVGRFTTTAPVSYAPESPGGVAPTFPPVRFGGNVTFLGYEPFASQTYRPGDYLTIVSYWRVDGVVPSDLRLFTHVLFDPVSIAAQSDVLSVLPAQLQPRDIFIQVTFVRLPNVLTAGRYQVSIGAYEDNTDTRLPVFDGDEQRGTRVFLPEIMITSN